MLPRATGPRLLADDNQARGDADTRLKRDVGRRFQRADSVEDRKAGAHGLLGIMLIGRRVTEIDVHPLAEVLRDKSVEARHHVGDQLVEGGDQIVHVLGVETCRSGIEPTMLQTRIVSCRRSGLPERIVPRAPAARDPCACRQPAAPQSAAGRAAAARAWRSP